MLQTHFQTGSAHQQSASACVSRPFALPMQAHASNPASLAPCQVPAHYPAPRLWRHTLPLVQRRDAEVRRNGMHAVQATAVRRLLASCLQRSCPCAAKRRLHLHAWRAPARREQSTAQPCNKLGAPHVRITRLCACTAVQPAGAALQRTASRIPCSAAPPARACACRRLAPPATPPPQTRLRVPASQPHNAWHQHETRPCAGLLSHRPACDQPCAYGCVSSAWLPRALVLSSHTALLVHADRRAAALHVSAAPVRSAERPSACRTVCPQPPCMPPPPMLPIQSKACARAAARTGTRDAAEAACAPALASAPGARRGAGQQAGDGAARSEPGACAALAARRERRPWTGRHRRGASGGAARPDLDACISPGCPR